MKIDIHTKNITLTSAMSEHVMTQFEKLTKYSLITENSELHLTIEVLKENKSSIKGYLEKTNYHSSFSAEVIAESFYQAVELLVHKFDEQIFKVKDKKEDLHRHKQSLKRMFINSDEDINSDENI